MHADATAPARPPRDITMTILRLVQVAIALPLGASAVFFFGASDFAHTVGYSSDQARWLSTAAATAAYLTIGVLAFRDIRASSLIAIPLCLASTPLFAFLWLFSQWSEQGSHSGHPLVYYMGGNVILIHAAIWALVRAMRERKWLATR